MASLQKVLGATPSQQETPLLRTRSPFISTQDRLGRLRMHQLSFITGSTLSARANRIELSGRIVDRCFARPGTHPLPIPTRLVRRTNCMAFKPSIHRWRWFFLSIDIALYTYTERLITHTVDNEVQAEYHQGIISISQMLSDRVRLDIMESMQARAVIGKNHG